MAYNEPYSDPQKESAATPEGNPPEVKRENPYLRKNRERRESAEKPPKPPKNRPTRASSADESSPDESGKPRRTFSQFMSEHVKLITTILTCLCILSLVIITDVTGWIDDYRFKQEQKDKTPLTLSHVRALCDRGQDIVWSDLVDYARLDTDTSDNAVTWKFEVKNSGIEGAMLELWISGVDTSRPPTYVRLYDYTSGEALDLNKGNLDLFLDRIEELIQP